MSKNDEPHPGIPESPLDTAVTIVQPRQGDAAGSGASGAEAERPYVTEVTIAGPDAAAEAAASAPAGVSAAPEEEPPIEATIPMEELRHTARTEALGTPAAGSGAAAGELQPGDRIERYVIVKLLGRGGMGSVYLARHETLGVFRAIKVLSGALYERGKEFTRRFIQEARLASSISNPNIVNVLDVGEDPERSFCYIIMEYVDGGTVRDVLKRIPRLSELHAVVIAEAVAAALDAAAEQKIVHRDIKPDNIMLTRRGEVKLADLGIAKNTDENVQLTKSHVMMGTPAYLAPEQAQDAHSVDVRADIYSLGATLFEMLTGQIPYPGKSTYDILRKLVSEPVPDPRTVVDTVSAPTAHLVMRMLAKQAKQRPGSAAELLRDIHKLNFLPADLDTRKCIRELLEQSGEGSYSAVSPTSATGSAVSSWFARHVILRAETVLRKIPFFAAMLEAAQRNVVLSYVILGLLLLLLLLLPVARLAGRGGSGAPEGFDPAAVAVRNAPDAQGEREPSESEVAGAAPPAVKTVGAAETPPPPETAEKSAVPAVPEHKTAAPPAAKPPAVAKAQAPAAPPRVKEVKKIAFSAEVSPAGAAVVLRHESGRVVERREAPPARRMEFNVHAGQYKLEVSAPGFKAEAREFPLSESRVISGLKIDLEREVANCRIELYGFPKLLAYLRRQGVELSVDGGEWRKVHDFPVGLELARTAHTVALRAKGIQPVRQSWSIAPDQTKSTVEVYLQEKQAELEIVSEVKGKILINLFGIWEEPRPRIAVPPFRAAVLKWKVEGGGEQTLDLPELLPESVRRIVLKENRSPVFEGAAEFAEGKALFDSGDYAPAAEKLKDAAEKGNPEAMYLLGRMAEQGKGRWFASDKEALAEYGKAAEAPYEYAKAQFKMGDFCENGRGGLSRDLKQAVVWYKKAAAKHDPDALFRLAMVYRDGEGNEPVDHPKMFELVMAAAEQGHLEAQYQLGYCYENGIGVPINVERAKFWYAKAAERGHGGARGRGRALEGIK